MSVIAQLQIGENIYDVLSFRYRFEASTDKKGRPTSRFRGGEIIVVLEVGSDTTIQELFLSEEPRAIRGSLNVWNEEDMTPIRTIEWEKGYIYSIRETMQRDTSSPMTITVSITPLRLDINRTTRLDRRVPQTYGFWWEEYKPEESVVSTTPKATPIVLVKTVSGPSKGFPNETLIYKATDFTNSPTASDFENIKWKIKIGDTYENLTQKGQSIKIKLEEKWAGEDIVVMAYLNSPDEEVAAKTKVRLEAVIVFVNGYWNSGKSDLPADPITAAGGLRLYKILKMLIAEEAIGTVAGEAYWQDGVAARAYRFFQRKYEQAHGKNLEKTDYIYLDGSHVWNSSGATRWQKGVNESHILSAQLGALEFYNENAEPKKRLFFVTHSMGAAYAEGLLRRFKNGKAHPDMVLHLAAADNSDFSVAFPEKTYQINIEPDPVLSYKNSDDRRRTQKETDEKMSKFDRHIINGMKKEHFIVHEVEFKWINHAYTKSRNVWFMVDFLNP